ncbi:DEAD/DEAH box helicase [Nocardia sp. CNY236]|uniref:DEAD/DEAH box helicase n=1 Tax=Nocardia sp. CNY236 TaxID=1169152 RepID=UPI001E3337E5|nr:DEAD/DEAH box helicase [Nocardia sp. CNY236]
MTEPWRSPVQSMQIEDDVSDVADPRPPILWMKIADPDTPIPPFRSGTDMRVLIPIGDRFTTMREQLHAQRIPFREVGYLLEHEVISTLNPRRELLAAVGQRGSASSSARPARPLEGAAAEAARDGFDLMWHNHVTPDDFASGGTPARSVPVDHLVPPAWIRFLPHDAMNPAQAEAVPHIIGSDDHVLVVAPTGAGKTVIGMVAALRTVLEHGKKAAWLVPQRSLTDELNRELDSWRRRGLRVERLSGEYRVDAHRIRAADLWVTTTEKFEAICRTSTLREALAEVGCLVVDEIHLLGDSTRGSFLEAILARVRGSESPIRIVGLSATVANADQIAAWLHARTVRVAWRPTRLTWQLPTVANSTDWSLVEAAKVRLTTSIVAMVTRDNGSVVVFCGSKRNVRRTALIIAASRGATGYGIDPDDVEAVHRACRAVGVGLHYKGWEHKREAEQAFRAREFDVLVATSTVAAGVNLPARAVIVQDTEVGLKAIDVATVQQMFGRAGRVGAGERQGWAFLLVDETERSIWQRKLLAGFRVNSRIQDSLTEHVLAEATQERIHSVHDAERWYEQTLSYHQGSQDMTPLRQAVGFLDEGDFFTRKRPVSGEDELVPTELGLLTARLMVPPDTCHRIRAALAEVDVPDTAEDAEAVLIETLAAQVVTLARAAISEDLKQRAVELELARGFVAEVTDNDRRRSAESSSYVYAPGVLARAVLLTAANSPTAFHRGARTIGGIPYATMYPILEQAPRYLHWLGCQGFLGTVHPWVAIVAADLSRRIRWRRCNPPRGAGRLLWMCEQMATAVHADDVVPALWRAATARGITNPDWGETGRPQDCRLSPSDYATLLRDRVTQTSVTIDDERVTTTCSTSATLMVWSGTDHVAVPVAQGRASAPLPAGDPRAVGAAVFTRRGDYRAVGWLGAYSECAQPSTPATPSLV